MPKTLPLAASLLFASLALGAAELPPLLSNQPLPATVEGKAPAVTPVAEEICLPPPPLPVAILEEEDSEICPAPPPLVASEDLCPPAPLAPSRTLAAKSIKVLPSKTRATVVKELHAVPIKRRVVAEEIYTVEEKRHAIVDEVRTREVTRYVPVVKTRQVSEAKIITIVSEDGGANRLARGVSRRVATYQAKEPTKATETYMVKIRSDYTVPVTKTRRVTQIVDDVKFVERRVKVEDTDVCPLPAPLDQ
ncbi:MAG: hypothetical protein LBU79_05530 [Planctomycetota bacterium]|jgi:hypothetical protein|nr:hypothetical protein [Planctomycetota bacterium]